MQILVTFQYTVYFFGFGFHALCAVYLGKFLGNHSGVDVDVDICFVRLAARVDAVSAVFYEAVYKVCSNIPGRQRW